jgi:sulfoxide reductase catalytic subunit YedY
MNIIHSRGWELPESQATPEHLFMSRRTLLRGAAALAGVTSISKAGCAEGADPTADLYPAKRNEKYKLDREMTPEKVASYYNNFYEYGQDKYIASRAQQLKTRPWTVMFDGMV